MKHLPGLAFVFALFLVAAISPQENSIGSTTASNNQQSGGKSIFQATFGTNNVGRFKHQDGEVVLSQNQHKSSDFFFTPFPHIEPNLTDCNYNELSGHNELVFSVSLYTPSLLEAVVRHIKQHQNICRTEHCDVSLLPMHSIRLFQKGLRTTESRNKYTLDETWHSNTQLRQSIEFIIYTSTMSVCESLKNSIASRCRLSNFEVHYLLHGQQTVARKLEISTEHISGTSMFNQIRSQFPSDSQSSVALMGNDYKTLLIEITDQITMNLRVEEGFEGLQDPVAIDKILERQLQYKEVQIRSADDQLWNSLYWTPELTRPDRLSKILNKIIKKDSEDVDKFVYDYSQDNDAFKQNLQLNERQKLDNLQKHLATESQNVDRKTDVGVNYKPEVSADFLDIISGSAKLELGVDVITERRNLTNTLNNDLSRNKTEFSRFNNTDSIKANSTTRAMQRKDAEKLVKYLSEHVELEGDIVRPKSIDVKLVKFGSLKSSTKLFSNSVLVRTRTDVHILPLRCPYEFRQNPSSITRLEEKYDRISSAIDNFTNAINGLQEKLTINVNKTTAQLIENVQGCVKATSLSVGLSESRLNQTLIESIKRLEIPMNSMESRLAKTIQENGNATSSAINQTMERSCQHQRGISVSHH